MSRSRRPTTRLAQGVHRRAGDPNPFLAELDAWQAALPGTVFTGLTAARLYQWWLPPVPHGVPVFVRAGRNATHSKRAGVRVFRQDADTSWRVGGVLAEAPAETLLACARDLSLLDMVMLIDSALQLGSCTRAQVEAVACGRRRGAPRLREALAWCDGRSESAWETLLRVLLVSCDVPVEPQVEIFDVEHRFLARADLLIVGTPDLMEYDGGHHREAKHYAADRRREGRLARAGYRRHGWVAEHVTRTPEDILRAADHALGRPHDPTRLARWRAMLADSLFSDAGQRAFLRRIARKVEPSDASEPESG